MMFDDTRIAEGVDLDQLVASQPRGIQMVMTTIEFNCVLYIYIYMFFTDD